MDKRSHRTSLARAAQATVPLGDPAHVAGTSLPAMKARQDVLKSALAARTDRFSQLISKGLHSEFVGDRLVGSSLLTEEERQELMQLATSAAADLFAELTSKIKELRALLATLDPLTTTAQISFNHIFGPMGGYHEPTNERSEVAVEVVGSIFATQLPPLSTTEPDSSQIQRVEDLLAGIRQVQTMTLVAQAWAAGDDVGYLRMIGQLRMSAVRGESYAAHGRDLALAIYGPIEGWMRAEFGFNISELFAVADAAADLIATRVNAHLPRFAEILNILDATSSAELTDKDRLALGGRVQSFFEELPRQLVFSTDDVALHAGLDPPQVKHVIDELSLIAGEVADVYRSPLDPSPLSQRPFLRVDDRYVLPVPGHLLRSTSDILEARLLQRFKGFSKHRADVVDLLALDFLEQALPGAKRLDHAYYEFDDGGGRERYEADGVMVFEDFCLVVEGKAAALSTQAQRGDLARLQRDIGATVSESWEQCARVHRYLMSANDVIFSDQNRQMNLTVERTTAKTVLYINPMLHSLGAYAFELPRLRALSNFGAIGFPWPVLVTDLRVITQLAGGPAQLLHYLQWRSSLPIGEGISTVDELDVFGTYLFGGVGRMVVEPNEVLSFASSTSDFDDYYNGLAGDGPTRERPHRVLGEWLEQTLNLLAELRPSSWLSQSFTILDLPLDEAAALTAWAETVAYREIGNDRWRASSYGGSVFAAIRRDLVITDVLFEVGPTRESERWFVIRLDDDGPKLIHAQRQR